MLRAIVALFILVSFLPNASRAAEVTIRFPVEYSLDITPGLANQEFKRLVEERTKGRVEVKLFPSGSLYKGLDLLQALLRGDAEMTTLISAYWSALSPRLAVFELPYVFPTKEAFYKAVDDGFFEQAYGEVESKGGKIIGVLPFDYLVPGTKRTAIRNPRDMAGLKMRGLGRVNLAMLKALGATPVSLNFVELSPAIQQGVIDGLNVPTDNYLIYKWNESIKHVTYANYYIAFYPWMVNATWWNKLDPELRKIIQEVAVDVARRHRERAEAESQKAITGMRAVGVDVHIQTPEERKVWIEATRPVWKEFETQIGPQLIERVQQYGK
ncbi:C4-dicarboxylate-binding periplasmic protein precursor [Variibacter gotjawalensis]|uniref:C4-dicarboxylate-binding periplasmic protein n=1 Tax=Variibacter gotjawalensis TaxID=1333996 RepID=A0A0S3PRM0_9BRAD|nr:TRAP transporter substrate-binding protein DctP [Variibacter gotjawalensis]NIK48910.1 C4-dicarboxylate-binding protein DctP [Variibacter gotjawalensis]RZS50766.1 C4-dicarboxylate-binding protein DctP [Variibacter gotjawalensis]BAT58600.1 C4-dicarboxylate-binding periplasmic protein precursor [Variibacter gotjawalensis]